MSLRKIVHTADYTNGAEMNMQGQKVLLVGFGNSAAEIALDMIVRVI